MELLRKHNKKIMAVLGVFLMIVFILPTTQSGNTRDDFAIGRVGDEDLTASQVRYAQYQWQVLQKHLGLFNLQMMMGGMQPLLALEEHPEMFVLLQREAERMGVRPDQDLVNTAVTSIPTAQNIERDEHEALRTGLLALTQITAAFDRAAGVIKVSEPVIMQELAEQQLASVKLVEVPADRFADQVAALTPEQLQEQFNAYKDETPGQTDPKANPFGFAYRYPDRVKLQYVQIPRDQVKSAVEATKTEQEWEVEAWMYYLQNQNQFAAIAPPATQPATTTPTTRPFEEVRQTVIDRVIAPLIDEKARQVQALVLARLQAQQTPAGATTQPSATSHADLEQIAQHVQQQTGVLPTVVSLTEQFRAQDELRTLGGIGQAFTADGQSFAQYAIRAAEPLLPEQSRNTADVLSLSEPSVPLRDFAGNVYIFRLTDAQAAHSPTSLDEIAQHVEADVRRKMQFERAKQQAQQIAEQARQQGIESAAQGASATVIAAGPFGNLAGANIPGYALNGESAVSFIEQVFDLVKSRDEQTQPVTVIELPRENKALAVQLTDVQSQWTADQLAQVQTNVRQIALGERLNQFQQDWFNWHNIQQRLNYRPATGSSAPAPTPETPNIPRSTPIGA